MNRSLQGWFKAICQLTEKSCFLIALVLALVGCATTNTPPVSPVEVENTTESQPPTDQKVTQKEVPKQEENKVTPPKSIAMWVPKGSGAFLIETQRIFHGIGGAASSSNPLLLRASADNQSRQELERILTDFMTFVTKTYWNDGGKSSSEVGNLEVLNNTFVAVAKDILSNSRISGHWQDPKSGEFYALCQLPLSDLIKAVSDDTRLDKRSKGYFLNNAEKLYDQFRAESEVESS